MRWCFNPCSCSYLAPECVRSGPITPSIDVFAFGVVLLELVTGLVAFDPDRTPQYVSRHVSLPPTLQGPTLSPSRLLCLCRCACACLFSEPLQGVQVLGNPKSLQAWALGLAGLSAEFLQLLGKTYCGP